MNRVDVVALLSGLLMTAVAVGALWLAFVGSINWQLVRLVAPSTFVVIGVLGLALSRNRTS